MSLPAYLQQNFVSIYGKGSKNKIVFPSTAYKFGIVDQTYSLLPNIVAVGNSVMFKEDDALPYKKNDNQYYLIEETKIILIESTAEEA